MMIGMKMVGVMTWVMITKLILMMTWMVIWEMAGNLGVDLDDDDDDM